MALRRRRLVFTLNSTTFQNPLSITGANRAGAAITQQATRVTLTGLDPGDSFKYTYDVTETVAFVDGVNCTAAAMQTALRTLTGDTGLTVTGTDDAGPFTITYTDGYASALPITATSETGCTATEQHFIAWNPGSSWFQGSGPYTLRKLRGGSTASLDVNSVLSIFDAGHASSLFEGTGRPTADQDYYVAVEGYVYSLDSQAVDASMPLIFDWQDIEGGSNKGEIRFEGVTGDVVDTFIYYESRGDYRF